MRAPYVLALLLTGCSLVPDFITPDMPLPERWRNAPQNSPSMVGKDTKADAGWWNDFGNAELKSFVENALGNNKDIEQSLARIEQARALMKIAGAPLYPDLGVSGQLARNYTDPPNAPNRTVTSYRAGLQLSYELDLFGRNRANANAARATESAVRFDHEALELIVAADTAEAWLDIQTLQDRVAVASRNLDNARSILRIVSARFQAGTVSALELSQQKTDIANREAAVALLAQQQETARSRLALLMGKTSQTLAIAPQGLKTLDPPAIVLTQPAELLARRPDIAAAEADLKAANFDIGAARAAFFPSLTIGLGPTLSATPSSGPVTIATDLVAPLTAPLFTGGALQGGLVRATARQKELAALYKEILLTAFKEVEDGLAAVNAAETRLAQFREAATQAQRAYELSRLRFDVGITDFQTLLDSQRALFAAEDALIVAQEDKLLAAVGLYRALGGGWKNPA